MSITDNNTYVKNLLILIAVIFCLLCGTIGFLSARLYSSGVGFMASPGSDKYIASPEFLSQSSTGTNVVELNDEWNGLVVNKFTEGGGITSTSTVNATETLLITDIDTENRVDYTMNVQATTLTLMASTTFTELITTAGDSMTIDIKNATTTPINLTIAAGTGLLIHNATSTLIVPSGDFAMLTFKRKSNTDIDVFFNIYQ